MCESAGAVKCGGEVMEGVVCVRACVYVCCDLSPFCSLAFLSVSYFASVPPESPGARIGICIYVCAHVYTFARVWLRP